MSGYVSSHIKATTRRAANGKWIAAAVRCLDNTVIVQTFGHKSQQMARVDAVRLRDQERMKAIKIK